MNAPQRLIIAIDGPAGAGKSTLSRLLAQRLGYVYLDTGAMYRAIAFALLREDIALDQPEISEETLARLPLSFALENAALAIRYAGHPLNEELRGPDMSQAASLVSRNPSVRRFLTEWQRRLGAGGGIVAEGRDMATVVFPHAQVKVFLTADLSTRAARRREEYLQKGLSMDPATLEAQMRTRDEADANRSIAPLRAAPDALLLDTSGLGIEEVLQRLLDEAARRSA